MKKNKIKTNRHQLGRIHPLMATAAAAVTLVSLVGIAAITGVIPSSYGTPGPVVAMNSQTPLMSSSGTVAPASNYVAVPDPVPASAPAPAYVPAPNYPPAAQNYAQAPAPAPVIHHAPQQRVDMHNASYADRDYQVAQGPAVCNNCGRVESIITHNEPAKPSGLGIAAGAVLGGVLGNQVGGGNGRTLATVAGAVAGGYGGNEVEKRTRSTTTYQVRVKMDNGKHRTFPQNGQDGWRVGDRVRVVNGALVSRG